MSTSVFSETEHSHKKKHGHSHSHGHRHSHKVVALTKKETSVIARTHILRLVKLEKIDVSWKSAIFDKSENKDFHGNREWVVTFDNEKGVQNKKIYIFLKESGEFVAANFTGK